MMLRSRHLDVELFRGQLIKQSQRAPTHSYARRGAVRYQSSSAKWSRLNSVSAIYEYEVGAQGEQSLRVLGMGVGNPPDHATKRASIYCALLVIGRLNLKRAQQGQT